MRSGAVAGLGVLLLAGAAHATDILAAGGLFGSPAQKTAVCFIYNGGTALVTLTTPHIYNQAGAVLALTEDDCQATLGVGRICHVAADIDDLPYACRTFVTPSKSNIRGMFEVRDASGVVLQNIQLR